MTEAHHNKATLQDEIVSLLLGLVVIAVAGVLCGWVGSVVAPEWHWVYQVAIGIPVIWAGLVFISLVVAGAYNLGHWLRRKELPE